jgi:hypothetical protein
VEDKLTYRGRNNDGDEGLVVVVGTGNRRGEGDLETPSPQGDTATQIQHEASQKKPRTEARRTRSGNDRKTGGGSKGLARLVRWGTRIRGGEDRMRHNAQYYLEQVLGVGERIAAFSPPLGLLQASKQYRRGTFDAHSQNPLVLMLLCTVMWHCYWCVITILQDVFKALFRCT